VSDDARRYTPEQATALLPELIPGLERIRDARQTVLSRGERIRASAPSNGGGEPGTEYWTALATLRREVEAISKRDILLRDAEAGLLDFPGIVDGREVFLCWHIGEERVSFWHGSEAGFSGRHPL
jgi:hypothetical protein